VIAPYNSSRDGAVVDPSLRPLEPSMMSRSRRRLAFILLVLGFSVIIVGAVVSFGQPLFIAGSVLVIASLFLFGRFRCFAEKPDDARKLYLQRKI